MSLAWVAIGAAVLGTATSAGMSASAQKSQSSSARKAAQAALGNNLLAMNMSNQGADRAIQRLNPYAGLGKQAATALQGAAFGNTENIFKQAPIIADVPKRGDFKNAKDYTAAMKSWKQDYKQLRTDAAARGINLPALSSFTTTAILNTPKGPQEVSQYDEAGMREYVKNWNLKQQPLLQLQKDLAAKGITNADQYQTYMDKQGQFTPGGLMRNYTVDQYNTENGTDFSMKDAMTPYTTDKYKQQWGVDPTTLLNPGDFQASPDYQFRKQQGMAGIEQGAAGRGSLLSGATLKALNDYNSNLASGEYANWWNRDYQNRQSGLQNFWNANTKDAQDRAMQYAGFTDAFNRNMTNKQQALGTLTTMMGAGQTAATNQGNWDYGAGNTLASILQGNGQQQSNLAMQQGQIAANGAANTNNAIQGGLSNMSTVAMLYGLGQKGYTGNGLGQTALDATNGLSK